VNRYGKTTRTGNKRVRDVMATVFCPLFLAWMPFLPARNVAADAPAANSSIKGLWESVDPRKEPLEVETRREWNEESVQYTQLYFTGETWEGEKTRIYAVQGAPTDGKNLPGILHIHGGGQTASQDWVKFWAKRGYVCVTFDFCGDWRKQAPDRVEFMKWGKVHADMAEVSGGISMKPTPRHNPWFHWALTARRALTLLERNPQVDADRLGIFGISVGGTLTWLVAAMDERVKTAVPIYGCGWTTYTRPDQTPDDPVDEDTCLWRRLISPEAYAPLVRCPLLFMNATNDFHGNMDRSFLTLSTTASAIKRQIYTPRYNHHIEPSEGKDLALWMDWRLKGAGGPWPETPGVRLMGGDAVPRVEVIPDQADIVSAVHVFYALNNPWPQSRFWRDPSAAKNANGTWSANAPYFSTDDTLYVFANVTYPSGSELSSTLLKVSTKDLPGVKPTLAWEPMIDDMADSADWRYGPAYTDPSIGSQYFQDWQGLNGEKGFTLNPAMARQTASSDTIAFDFGTHKIGDPQWRGQDRAVLLLDCFRRSSLKELRVVLIERDWQPNRKEYTINVPPGEMDAEWQTVRIDPAALTDTEGHTLPDWREVNCLTLKGTATKAAPPVFSNLRWEKP